MISLWLVSLYHVHYCCSHHPISGYLWRRCLKTTSSGLASSLKHTAFLLSEQSTGHVVLLYPAFSLPLHAPYCSEYLSLKAWQKANGLILGTYEELEGVLALCHVSRLASVLFWDQRAMEKNQFQFPVLETYWWASSNWKCVNSGPR